MDFRPLTIADAQRHYRLIKPIAGKEAEWDFAALYVWKNSSNINVCHDPMGLFYRYQIKDKIYFSQPIPEEGVDFNQCVQKLMDYAKEQNIPFIIAHFNQKGMDMLNEDMKSKLKFAEERNFYDYLYAAEDLRNLSGKKYHAKRNHISKFNRLYSYTYEPITADNYAECMEMYNTWVEDKAEHEAARWEMYALQNAFENFEALNLIGGGIRIDGKLRAFTLADKTLPDLAVIHFEKADTQFEGIYATINQLFAQNALGDVNWINREEDMGLEGLRKAKLSYQPAQLLKKWTATLK